MRLAVKFDIIDMFTFMFAKTGIIYLFIINRLLNIRKINMSNWDHILLFLVIFQTLSIIIGIFFQLLSFYNIELVVKPLCMVEGNTNLQSTNNTAVDTASNSALTNTTNVNTTTTIAQPVANVENENTSTRTVIERKIIIDNGSWSDSIRTIFIYGSATIKVALSRGSPRTRAFVVTGAIATDIISKFSMNVVNDPTYIRAHVQNWKITKSTLFPNAVDVDISQDKEFVKNITNKFLPEDLSNQIDAITQEIVKNILSFFQPQTVNYPVDLLMEQHQFLAIFLFLLILLLFFFLLNLAYVTTLLVFKDKILSYFKNKYILKFLKLQYNLMHIEFIFLIMLILYDFYSIINISYFLCTYPIVVNINK